MSILHLFFLIFKTIVFIQIILIVLKKEKEDNVFFIITETIFKIGLALFLVLYFEFSDLELNISDKMLFIAAAFVIIFEIDYKGLYNIYKKLLLKS
jgi:hypothetical protein